ncbi:MAG: hypothetical protein HP000_10840 [Odoribacter sp.]|nr:hypothetical protein [Odoribacter sp.]
MADIFYETEDGHWFDYDDIFVWLAFKMKELKQEGGSDEDVLEYFPNEDFEGELGQIDRWKRMILKLIKDYQ